MPRRFICTERQILEPIVVLDANLIGNVVMPGIDERKPLRWGWAYDILKKLGASARCYRIRVRIFTSACVPETVYTGKWWTTRDLFLGWIYYLFLSGLNEKRLEGELSRLPRLGVPQIFQYLLKSIKCFRYIFYSLLVATAGFRRQLIGFDGWSTTRCATPGSPDSPRNEGGGGGRRWGQPTEIWLSEAHVGEKFDILNVPRLSCRLGKLREPGHNEW